MLAAWSQNILQTAVTTPISEVWWKGNSETGEGWPPCEQVGRGPWFQSFPVPEPTRFLTGPQLSKFQPRATIPFPWEAPCPWNALGVFSSRL